MAQIEVSPTRVLLTNRIRSQEIHIYNSTNDQVEVTTELGFKLIDSDSLGTISLRDPVTPEEESRSCKEWIKIFPRRFLINPGSSRSVRVLIVPPDSIGDGEFWGRVIFGSAPVHSDRPNIVDTISTDIRSSLSMRLKLDIPVIFRRGVAETGVILDDVTVKHSNKGILVLADMRRQGNSAYRGTMRLRVRNAEGGEIVQSDKQFTTEFSLRSGIHLPQLPPGSYLLEIELVSVKKGAANDVVLTAPTIKKLYDVTISPTNIHVQARE